MTIAKILSGPLALVVIATQIIGGPAFAQAQPNGAKILPPEVQEKVELAFLLANDDLYKGYLPTLMGELINPGAETPLRQLSRIQEPIAVKAFDDLYYVGLAAVGTWALQTPDGIILWDALNNAEEAETILVPGLKKLGLDPAQIKYVVIAHGHGDHYGGARYIQDTYKARILMGAGDWDMVAKLPEERNGRKLPAAPKHDLDVIDGQKLTLGGKSVTLYVTAGHTPATVSSIIPTTYQGKPHVVAFWGGNGMPRTLEPTDSSGGLLAYREQLVRFTRLGIAANVDAVISNHPVVDGTVDKAKAMATIKRTDPNPWVVGQSTFIRVMGSNIVAMDAGIAYARSNAQAAQREAQP